MTSRHITSIDHQRSFHMENEGYMYESAPQAAPRTCISLCTTRFVCARYGYPSSCIQSLEFRVQRVFFSPLSGSQADGDVRPVRSCRA